MEKKNDIRSLTLDELTSFFQKNSLPSYKAKQVYEWLWKKSCLSFDEMTNISLETRKLLKNKFVINHINIDRFQKSNDGTIKNAIALFDDLFVESVLIPTKNRTTACVSSQVGCSLDCEFCATSKMDRIRNLNPDEIYDQVVTINSQSLNYYGKPLSNIVFMGMGEPLYNYDSVKKSVQIFSDKEGIKLSTKRITLSTSGIVPQILEWGKEVDTVLAISLHATNDELRNEIVPINKKYPLDELIQACRDYPRSRNSRRITFEYVMLKGVNDSLADAKALVNLISGIPAKINLIPFNPWPDSPYECSSNNQIKKFGDFINDAGYSSPVRKTRGQDIMAACDQLKSDSVKIRKSVSRLQR